MAIRAVAKSNSRVWLYNPWLDMIVGCGAWSAPLLLITYFAADSSTIAWSAAFYFLALFFNFPHYMATIYRAYGSASDFQKYRAFTLHITGLLVFVVLLAHFWVGVLPWIFTLYLTWSPWHYGGQNYGLFMMFIRRAGADPSPLERRALHGAFILSYLVLFLTLHTGTPNDPLFLSLGIPQQVSSDLLVVLGTSFIACSGFGLSRIIGRVGIARLLPALTLYSTQFLWFLLPATLSLGGRLQIPPSRYSTGVLAVMHSAQYLWITSYYARREAGAESAQRWRPFAYFGLLFAGGIALFIPGPWLASRVFHFDFTSSFLIFTALVNIHHFILDGAIWKLRDGRIAKLLLGAKTAASETTAHSPNSSLWGWISGSSSSAHALRIGAACALLILGSVDQIRYYFALHRDNLSYLHKAAALDSFDSALQGRIASEELEAGDSASAVAAWQMALAANPADTAKRDQLLKYWTDHKQFREAYELTKRSLKYAPRDLNLLVDNGILAENVGEYSDAVESWQRALAVDPQQSNAHLYLASELDRAGKSADAIPHYTSYLQSVAKAGAPNRPPSANIIATVLRLGQCQAKASRLADAERSYELARTIAHTSGDEKLESFAGVREAEVAAALHDNVRALQLYQSAISLDTLADARQIEATDLYNYGVFLRNAGFPARLAYACLVKSQQLMAQQAGQDAGLKTIAQARDETAKMLTRDTTSVNRNRDKVVEEALELKSAP